MFIQHCECLLVNSGVHRGSLTLRQQVQESVCIFSIVVIVLMANVLTETENDGVCGC